jgi:hypothetical protein
MLDSTSAANATAAIDFAGRMRRHGFIGICQRSRSVGPAAGGDPRWLDWLMLRRWHTLLAR